mgnify:CR=1 FL=1
MINPSFKELAEISASRYEVCVMVMKRARLLTDGSKPKIKTKAKKPVTVALDEIMAGEVKKDHSVFDEIRQGIYKEEETTDFEEFDVDSADEMVEGEVYEDAEDLEEEIED